MHLLILGLFLVIGILAYYIMTTSPDDGRSSDAKKPKIRRKGRADEEESRIPDDLRKEDNVIFLPSFNKTSSDNVTDDRDDNNA